MLSTSATDNHFTAEERRILDGYFTNNDRPVFALTNLPEVVKGALFARYSRSPKPLRRIFLDEFATATNVEFTPPQTVGSQRAERLYERVFGQYGDDSVAQLGGAHVACENISNLATKVLERGRLAAYLEQSTRYIRYDRQHDGQYLYKVPPEIVGSPSESRFRNSTDALFKTYSKVVQQCIEHFTSKHIAKQASQRALSASIRAQACDVARGLLPAATTSNVGVFASGQAYERMLLRLASNPLQEMRELGAAMLPELRQVIPAFLKRVDIPDRGGAWIKYLHDCHRYAEEQAHKFASRATSDDTEVRLVEYDPEGEHQVAAAILYEGGEHSFEELKVTIAELDADQLSRLLTGYCGKRGNRRHLPGRALEGTSYRFDILSDFGSFRDLQRHRMLTVEWQKLGVRHGYDTPDLVDSLKLRSAWDDALGEAVKTHRELEDRFGKTIAQYAVPFAFKLRYTFKLNARQAFHMLELRTGEQGHADYRRICRSMHRLIGEQAGHKTIAQAMKFVGDASTGQPLARLSAEHKQAAQGRQISLLPAD